jgi:hypothetical protein
MLVSKECWERGCSCYDDRVDKDPVEVVKRQWIGLTAEEILEIVDNHTEMRGGLPILYRDQAVDLAHSIRDKLQELNR